MPSALFLQSWTFL